jgi:hypothetical protein
MEFVTAVSLQIKTSEFVRQKPTDDTFPSAFVYHIQENERDNIQIHPRIVCKKPTCEEHEKFHFVMVTVFPFFTRCLVYQESKRTKCHCAKHDIFILVYYLTLHADCISMKHSLQ